MGCLPNRIFDIHSYIGVAENGVTHWFFDNKLTRKKEVQMPDYCWAKGSKMYACKCGQCGYIFEQLCSVGGIMTCPVCKMEEQIP